MTREEKRQRHEAMKAYKAEGHSLSEVAEKFGVSEGLAHRVCKGIAPQSDRRPKKYRNQYSYDTPEGVEERARKMVEKYAPSFEYAGNYTGSEGFCDIRCRVCGAVQRRSCIAIRHRHSRCEACYWREINEDREKRAEQKAKKQAEAKAKADRAAWERYERSISQMAFSVCKECGAVFIPSQKNRRYCSEDCRLSAWYNHNDRRLQGVRKDPGITLEKVYNRDGGVCHICGQLCDWTDYGEKGAGDNYPSIDHVFPLARGGTHTWDNVKLAHRWCNTVKRDSPPGRKA